MTLIVALAALPMCAQGKFDLHVGVGMSTVVGSDAEGTKNNFAYKVGVGYDIAVTENFSIWPALDLVNKGFKADDIDGSVNMAYLQIPVMATYKFKVGDNMSIAPMVGPYIAYGIYGSDIEIIDEDGSDKFNVFDSDGGYKRFDAGIKAGVAFNFDQFVISAEYSRGLAKLDTDFKQYNQAFGLTFGYKF